MLDISVIEAGFLLLVVAAGSAIQGTIGFGFGLVVIPFLSAIEPRAVPLALLVLSMPLNGSVLMRERAHVDVPGVAWVSVGVLAGTVGGVAVLRVIPEERLAVAFGVAVIVAALILIMRPPTDVGRRGRVAAGVVSGVINTVAGTGGPPIALAFLDRTGSTIRSTLAATFSIAIVLAIAAQAVAGRFVWGAVVFAGAMLPGVGIGFWGSSHLLARIDRQRLRGWVVGFVITSGVVTVLRAI